MKPSIRGHRLRFMHIMGCGGIGCEATAAVLDEIERRLGFVPECVSAHLVDIATDPHSDLNRTRGRWTPEVSLLPMPDLPRLAQHIGEEQHSWLSRYIDPEILRLRTAGEAIGVPKLGGLALLMAARNIHPNQEPSWLDKSGAALRRLHGKECLRELQRKGIALSQVEIGTINSLNILGANGGTGAETAILAAICQKWFAQRNDISINNIAVVVSGPYREVDGQETWKSILGCSLDSAMERIQAPGEVLKVSLGPKETVCVHGPLFDEVLRFEAAGRLEHNTDFVLKAIARSLVFRFLTEVGFNRSKSQTNIQALPAIRGLYDSDIQL